LNVGGPVQSTVYPNTSHILFPAMIHYLCTVIVERGQFGGIA